ncbi:MAG: hypothetical protein AAF721_09965 [Myxococcota bacterium]
MTRREHRATGGPWVTVAAAASLLACSTTSPATESPSAPAAAPSEPAASAAPDDPLAGREVVPNVDAQPGDVTTCPFSGRTFEVKAEHPKVEYGGKTYTICSDKAAESVRADPGKYLDDFAG